MNNAIRNITEIVDSEAKEYAMYTVEQRAIPNMIDGLKPVQRFMVYRALSLSSGNREKMHKLASVAGGVADAGYHHGEGSAQDSGALMANTWNNNFPLLDGQGNFGSRIVQTAAASRYIFCRVSENFRKLYKDFDVCPAHEDVEHLPPKFYLPVIPVVLLNGVSGIATGYSTSIMPHCPQSVIECTRLAVNGQLDPKTTQPEIKYPKFSGNIVKVEKNKYELHGLYDFTSKTQMYIKEIPYKYDRTKFVKVLDDLENAGFITYDDDCSKAGFGFKVKFRKEYNLPTDPGLRHEKIMKDFKLIERLSQFIVVIDETGKLNDKFESSSELINHFVKVRMGFIEKRIAHKKVSTKKEFELAAAKLKFIAGVISGSIIIQGKTRKELTEELSENESFSAHVDKLVSMNIYHITKDEAMKLGEEAKKLKSLMAYWESTTPKIEYLKDLDELSI